MARKASRLCAAWGCATARRLRWSISSATPRIDPAAPEQLLSDQPPPARQTVGGMIRLALSDTGTDLVDLDAYRAQGGLVALRMALEQLTPAQVIAQIKESKLVGRGGAAFPTGLEVAADRE